eukprot:scaffold1658_cov393-Prasinococcus_capsulatus_cf.AAC.15
MFPDIYAALPPAFVVCANLSCALLSQIPEPGITLLVQTHPRPAQELAWEAMEGCPSAAQSTLKGSQAHKLPGKAAAANRPPGEKLVRTTTRSRRRATVTSRQWSVRTPFQEGWGTPARPASPVVQ